MPTLALLPVPRALPLLPYPPNPAVAPPDPEVLELPANYRANGSTSPLTLVQTLPGVQPDSSGKYSIQGGLPFMSETSVDGISTQNVGNNNPLSDAWPSAEFNG